MVRGLFAGVLFSPACPLHGSARKFDTDGESAIGLPLTIDDSSFLRKFLGQGHYQGLFTAVPVALGDDPSAMSTHIFRDGPLTSARFLEACDEARYGHRETLLKSSIDKGPTRPVPGLGTL